MTNFKKINTKLFAKSYLEFASANIYKKSYNASVLVKEFGAIDYIDFSPIEPYYFAVTCSCRVQIYNPITKLVTKNLNRFKEIAYGGTFRKDGQLVCAGGDESVIKLFDVTTKNPLRIFAAHSAPVHRTYFTIDGTHIVSFSDDKTTALWDIPYEKKLITFMEHNDYVRAGAVSPICSDIYVSGGYDNKVNMYDVRTNNKVLTVNHDAPVESILFLPSGGIFLSAGGNEIKIWDCLASGKLLAKISQHHKTITCLQIASNGKRILSGSLDRHIKIYDSGTYKVLHTLDYPNSVLSIGISADNETLVAGMIDGMISIKQNERDIKKKPLIYKHLSYRYTGKNLCSPHINTYVNEEKKDVMGKHDLCLRKFQYSKALDCVMMNYIINKSPHITVALLQELEQRQGLIQALAGRDGKSLIPIIRFIIRYIGNINFGRTLLNIANVLIDIYEETFKELNLESQIMFKLLVKKLEEEQNLILSLTELYGAMEMILSAAEVTSTSAINHHINFIPSINAQKEIVLNIF